MSAIETLIPTPLSLETQSVDLSAPPSVVWEHLRHGDLGDSPLTRALFSLRTWPSRLQGHSSTEKPRLRIDDLRSSESAPGFQLLSELPPRELTVGAIGKVWQLDIPFLHVEDSRAFAAWTQPGWVKVAWEIRLAPRGESGSHLDLEVRVDATDSESWEKFQRYFLIVGPGSRFIRALFLGRLKAQFGSPDRNLEAEALPGDDLLPEAVEQVTHAQTIHASPAAVWPWLVQMGCRRGGYYSIDALDNGGVPSARQIHPELQTLEVGQVLPAAPESEEGFEVLSIDPGRSLVLGGLYDRNERGQLPFRAERPESYWQVTWAFVLESLNDETTRLWARARVDFSPSQRWHALWIRPVHDLMQTTQLRHLAERAEGRLTRDSPRDKADGTIGAAIMLASLLTPFLREARNHWGLTEQEAAMPRPGDALVPDPTWSWTHGIEIDAPAEEVWPWVVQLGADRAGFYSYQWLENLVHCELRNAEAIHPGWALQVGDGLVLHPTVPPIPIVSVDPGRSLVAFAAPDPQARERGEHWASASWAFVLEPLGPGRCRLVSRFRTAHSRDLPTRLAQGPGLLEPVGFAMDRRMLLGIRERVLASRQRMGHA